MTTISRVPRLRSRWAAAAAASVVALLAPAAASAADLTYTAPSGATVTFTTDKVIADTTSPQRVTFTGTGFAGTNEAAGGRPVFALKWDDNDTFVDWGPLDAGGLPDDVTPRFEIEEPNVASFVAKPNGEISGWVELPTNVSKEGPGEGAFAGQHWFRVLSGAFSTEGSITSGNRNVTVPITAKVHLSAVDAVSTGFTNAGGTFYAGTTYPAAPGVLTARGLGFPAGAAVTVKLDGATLAAKNYGTAVDLTADAGGAFNAAVTLVPGAPGARTLEFTSGAVTRTVMITRVAQSAAHVTSQTVRPGASIAVDVNGYVGIAGAGQKVALVLQPGDLVVGCAQTNASGAARITGVIPADTTAGAKSIFVAGGTACVPPLVTDPMPRLFQLTGAAGLTVSAAAPVLTSTFKQASVGGTIAVVAEGYAAGESVSAQIDGVAVGTPLTAGADGKITASIPVPAATALGSRVLTLVSNASATPTGVTAIGFKAVEAAKVTLTSPTTITRGDKATFDLTGFVRADATAGQKVGVKIGAGAIVECVQADTDGKGSGSIVLPATLEPGEYRLQFLAGSSCVSGTQNDLPSRSIAVTVQVVAAPVVVVNPPVEQPKVEQPKVDPPKIDPPKVLVPTASRIKSTSKGKSVELTVPTGGPASIKVSAKTKSKVKVSTKAKAKIVTLVKAKTVKPKSKTGKVTLTLTAEGRKLLKARGKLKIVVTIEVPGGTPTTKTFTLKA